MLHHDIIPFFFVFGFALVFDNLIALGGSLDAIVYKLYEGNINENLIVEENSFGYYQNLIKKQVRIFLVYVSNIKMIKI